MSMYNVFLSYNVDSKVLAQKVYKSLIKRGFSVFWDDISIPAGGSISRYISEALEQSEHAVFLVTEKWLKSEWCNLEEDCATASDPAAKNRVIIPILVEPDLDLPKILKRLKYIDFTDWETNYRRRIGELASQLKKKTV